jgi:hypothetical protein
MARAHLTPVLEIGGRRHRVACWALNRTHGDVLVFELRTEPIRLEVPRYGPLDSVSELAVRAYDTQDVDTFSALAFEMLELET